MTAHRRFFYSVWFLTICAFSGLTLLCALGCWQLSRAHQKEQLMGQAQQATHLMPFNRSQLPQMPDRNSLRFHPVQLQGSFLNEYPILLDNVINKGKTGYLVLVPLALNADSLILINRGWIPMGASRKNIPLIPAVKGEVAIEGYLDFAYRNSLISSALETTTIQWPLRMQQLDLGLLEKLLGKKIYPMLVTLNPESLLAFEIPAPHLGLMSAQRHYGYALQWFSLAAVLVGFYIFFIFRSKDKG